MPVAEAVRRRLGRVRRSRMASLAGRTGEALACGPSCDEPPLRSSPPRRIPHNRLALNILRCHKPRPRFRTRILHVPRSVKEPVFLWMTEGTSPRRATKQKKNPRFTRLAGSSIFRAAGVKLATSADRTCPRGAFPRGGVFQPGGSWPGVVVSEMPGLDGPGSGGFRQGSKACESLKEGFCR